MHEMNKKRTDLVLPSERIDTEAIMELCNSSSVPIGERAGQQNAAGALEGLRWDLVDAQYDSNRLARMFLTLCENAAPWMNDIQENSRAGVVITEDGGEVSARKPELRDQPRVRDGNALQFPDDTELLVRSAVIPAPSSAGSVAIHLHLYYADLADEFFRFFSNIPFPFDLYISCRSDADRRALCEKFSALEQAQEVIVRPTQNRGRDMAPLYSLFGQEIACHDYFLHVHSKKSLYSNKEQVEWRVGAMEELCGSELQVRRIFSLMQSSLKIGLFFPETFQEMPVFTHHWLKNGGDGRALCAEYDVEFPDGFFNYPVGSFFWARTDALRPLFDHGYTFEDFPEERGQTDGTLAHALERFIAPLAKSRGYRLAIGDREENVVRIDRSDKLLRRYLQQDLVKAKEALNRFNAVSFDIFDTLITRLVYQPDDLFILLGDQIRANLGLHLDFLLCRKDAERLAVRKYGAKTDIHMIYRELPTTAKITAKQAEQIKQMEIALEQKLCVPREETVALYRYLKRRHIPVYLVSDMYLPEDVVRQMLKKCGITDYDGLFLSCSMGLRKDDASLWRYLKQKMNEKKLAHIGDNCCSDMQIPSDLGFAIYPVLNPRDLFRMSPLYPEMKRYLQFPGRSPAESFALGKVVNGLLFNSPFAMTPEYQFRDLSFAAGGQALFGAVLLSFVQEISLRAEEGQTLLFLAREGYSLIRLYQDYVRSSGRRSNPAVYFLASRRAAGTAAITTETDVLQLLQSYYEGSLGNLLETRLGIEIPKELVGLRVRLPQQSKAVLELIRPALEELYTSAAEQRRLYRTYADGLIDWDHCQTPPLVVDLGYSGTIQYHLSRLLERQLDGFYLFTEQNPKPGLLGERCDSIFRRTKDAEDERIMSSSLYLESILQCPFGQLLRFREGTDGMAEPVYRDPDRVPPEIYMMQREILDYALEFAGIEQMTGVRYELDPYMAIGIFLAGIRSGMLPDELLQVFSVEDNFCGNGVKRLDLRSGCWVAGE